MVHKFVHVVKCDAILLFCLIMNKNFQCVGHREEKYSEAEPSPVFLQSIVKAADVFLFQLFIDYLFKCEIETYWNKVKNR